MNCCQKTECCKAKKTTQGQDYLVCTCMGIMKSEIVEAIDRGIDTFEGLAEALGVGTGCTTCVEEIYQILAQKHKKCC